MKDDLAYIEHIIECIQRIKTYTSGLSKAEFSNSELIQDAVIRNIEIIGEATKKISESTKQVYYEIPWKEMSGMRDKLIHDYMGVDIEVVWKTIETDIPVLYKMILTIRGL